MTQHSKGPTLEALHAIWLQRNQSAAVWPSTFEQAMHDPLCSRILKVRVLQMELVKLHASLDRITPGHAKSASRVTKPPREPDRAAYWMDTDDTQESP